jgi:hypothetical protein
MSRLRAARPPEPGIGRPAPFAVVAAFLLASLAALLAAAVALVAAADDLARGAFVTDDVVLAVHLVALGFLPLAIAGASLHVLPLFLRRSPSARASWASFAGLVCGPVLAVAVARHEVGLGRAAAAVVGLGLAVLLGEIVRLVVTAPRGRLVVVSRVALVACATHAALAFAIGPVLLERRWLPWAGIPHHRLIAIHLHLALVGAVALLIVAVGRTLVPMLGVSPTAPRRRLPVDELVLVAGTWVVTAGLVAGDRWFVGVGGAAVIAVLARFAGLAWRTLRRRRVPAIEGPVVYALAGMVFVAQASVLAAVLLGRPDDGRVLVAYAVSLVLGFGAGVTLGHVGKLLAVSAWTWWPPGPRPSQASFYRRPAWLGSAASWVAGVELVALGSLVGSPTLTRAGAAAVLVAAVVALAAAAGSLRPRAGDGSQVDTGRRPTASA